MKICPQCQQTYTDETLNFCLNDGSTLTQTGGAGIVDDLPQTVMIQPPRPTNPNQGFGNQASQSGQGFGNQAPQFGSPNQQQGNWNAPQQPQFSMQPQSAAAQASPQSSKTWMWVLGILGVGILLCGGGFGVLVLIGLNNDDGVNNRTKTSTPTPTPNNVKKYDMSGWKTGTGEFATTKYSGGTFTMEIINNDYYYVVLAKDFQTQDKITKLTVKNVDGKASSGGFGLLVHSFSTPLVGDYAFVIDSEKKRYRVIEHSNKVENFLINWKDFSDIKDGTQENVLEVRDNGGKMEFYINNKYVTSVDDKNNNTSGIAGIYSGESIPIAYSNLTTEPK